MTDSPETVYAIRISPAASDQAVAEYDRLLAGADAAERWREGLLAGGSAGGWGKFGDSPTALSDRAGRPALPADSSQSLSLVFVYHRKSSASAWRILFTAHEATAADPPFVQVHQLRHSAQARIRQWPIRNDD